MGGKFKFQVQDSDLEYLFWRFEKRNALSEKKATFMRIHCYFIIFCVSGKTINVMRNQMVHNF